MHVQHIMSITHIAVHPTYSQPSLLPDNYQVVYSFGDEIVTAEFHWASVKTRTGEGNERYVPYNIMHNYRNCTLWLLAGYHHQQPIG